MNIGLCLAGGGAKGSAHIGALKALEEEKIKISYISGCSSGSIVAVLYACGYKPEEILEMFRKYCTLINKYNIWGIVKSRFAKNEPLVGLIKGDSLQKVIYKYCKQKNITNINQIQLPLAIPTVDLITGEVIYFTNTEIKPKKAKQNINTKYDDIPSYFYEGNISEIVRASCSFPGVFEPKQINNKILIDGGMRQNIPASILKSMGANKIIAIDFESSTKMPQNAMDILWSGIDILSHQANIEEYNYIDILLKPKLKKISLLECGKEEYIFEQGYKCIKENINQIKSF